MRDRSQESRECSPAKEHIAEEIISYLSDHPNAGATLEAIMEWWLLERRIIRHKQAVQEVLEKLMAEGIVQKVMLPEARSYFQLNKNARPASST